MKIVLVGSNGTMGKLVTASLEEAHHEVVKVGRKSGDFRVQIEDAKSVALLYQKLGKFDAVVSAAGEVTFAPFASTTPENWLTSVQSKLLGQINLVLEALPYISEKGSFTLVSGILGEENILAGTIAATVNGALENFVRASANELPKGLRINIVSPTVLKESWEGYQDFFPGFIPVEGQKVGQAFKKSVMGIETGKIFRVN